jgi:hypothetical protein
VTPDQIYAAWNQDDDMTKVSASVAGVRMTWSDDAGKTWAPAMLASQRILGANYPALSTADDGRVDLIFQGRNPSKEKGWARTSAFVVEIGTDGKLSAPDEVSGMPSTAVRPTILASTKGRLLLLGPEHRKEDRLYFYPVPGGPSK